MEIKFIKQEELDGDMKPQTWYIVCLGAIKKHFLKEEDGRQAYQNAKDFYAKTGSIVPKTEVLISEVLPDPVTPSL